jgi:hypothetical protein
MPYRLVDGGGLCLFVTPSGAKLWRWRYRFNGKEKTMSFGEYQFVTLQDARELQYAKRKTLAAGVDPMAKRKAEAEAKQTAVQAEQREAENSFEKIARKWWDWWAHGKLLAKMDDYNGDALTRFAMKLMGIRSYVRAS